MRALHDRSGEKAVFELQEDLMTNAFNMSGLPIDVICDQMPLMIPVLSANRSVGTPRRWSIVR